MANNKLYITISDDRNGGNSTPIPTQEPKANTEKDGGSLLGRYAEHQFFNFAKAQATRAVNYSLSNIGNFTGDYITQQNVNELRQLASGFENIAMATITGAKFGPWGAVIGFVVGAGSLLVQGLYDNKTSRIENQKANYDLEQLRQRAGLNSLYDGSRGTEN